MSPDMTNFATERELTRLRPGMRIRDCDGAIYRVEMVNSCRALCIPENRTREVRIPKRFGEEGEETVFMARSSTISISPNSEVEIISR